MVVLMEFQSEALGLDTSHGLADRIFFLGSPIYMIHPVQGSQIQPLKLDVLHDIIEGCLHPRVDVHGDLTISGAVDLLGSARTDGRQALIKTF